MNNRIFIVKILFLTCVFKTSLVDSNFLELKDRQYMLTQEDSSEYSANFLSSRILHKTKRELSLDTEKELAGKFVHVIEKRSKSNKTSKKHDKSKVNALQDECKGFSTCEKCTENRKCMWCDNGKRCMGYPFIHGLPLDSDCKSRHGFLSDVKWGVCTVDFKTIAITIGVVGGVVVILLCCCLVKFCRCVSDCLYFSFCCCCCCSENGSSSKREERRLKRIEQQLERQARRQEIMLKFGLKTNAPYGGTKGYSQFKDSTM